MSSAASASSASASVSTPLPAAAVAASSESSAPAPASAAATASATAAASVPFDIDYHSDTPRFSAHDSSAMDAAMSFLSEHGYAVISDVGSAEEVERAHDLFWEFMSKTFPGKMLSRHNIRSWADLPIMQTGVCWAGGVGTSAFQWHIRSLPTVKAVFERVWEGEKNLVASFDGCGVFRPTLTGAAGGGKPVRHEEWVTKSAWFHVDQNPVSKPGRECVQGLFSVFDQDETTGGLVVIPGSHHAFNSLASLVKTKSTHDFVTIPNGHFMLDRAVGATRPKLVKCRAGDFVLWDSRTVHCNSPALRDQLWLAEQEKAAIGSRASVTSSSNSRTQAFFDFIADLREMLPSLPAAVSSSSSKAPPPRLQRLVSYQCMTPLSKVNPRSLAQYREARLEAVEVGMTTNHWAHEFHGGSVAGRDCVHAKVHLTEYQRELVVGKEE